MVFFYYMTFIIDVYYQCALFFIFMNLWYLIMFPKASKVQFDWIYEHEQIKAQMSTFNDIPQRYRMMLIYNSIYYFPFLIWLLIGLFTIQYPLFVLMVIYVIIKPQIIRFTTRKFTQYQKYLFFDVMLIQAFLLTVYINKYALHIDFTQILFKL